LRRAWVIVLAAMLGVIVGAARAADLDKGHRILIERGLQIHALVFSDCAFDLKQMQQAGFTGVNWGWTSRMEWLGRPPGIAWSRWLKNEETDLPPQEQPYAANAVMLSLADEQDLNKPEVREAARQWFDAMRAKFPNTILYTNQYGGQVTNEGMGAYMSLCKPDMLSFDSYPFLNDAPGPGGSPTNWYGDLQRYRKLSLGIGVPYQAWMQTFHGENRYRDPSESEMRLNQFASWTFGYTSVACFTYNAGSTNLFKGPGDRTPRDAFRQIAKINHESLNLGPALVRLKSTDVRIILGQHIDPATKKPVDNMRPIDVETWKFGANDPYLRGYTVENIGSKNDKLRGDVLIGWFKPLESGAAPEHADDIYMMVTNGLTDRIAAGPSCRQRITLNFHFKKSGIQSIQRLSRIPGKVENVPLKAIEKDPGRYVMTLELDGGTGELFKFGTGAAFVGAATVSGR
jgi:hypothetical protein